MWASRWKPKKALDLHPRAGILLKSLVFFPQRCRNRLLQPSASSGVVLRSSAKRYPTDGQAIPPLRTSCYSPAMADGPVNPRIVVLPSAWETTAESSPAPGHSLPRPRHRPRLGALDAACSTWSRNDFHRKRTVHGEADSWVHGHSPVFCDFPSKSLCQACWAANLSRRGELSFGWPRKWPISKQKWAVHF